MKKPKILMIVNEFPPVGESGVQRPLKFLKYLDKAGWETHVITPRTPSKTVLDYSLCDEIPANTKLHYTLSLGLKGKSMDRVESIRSNVSADKHKLSRKIIWHMAKLLNDLVFPYDKQVGWVPFAYFKALSVIKKYDIRNIFITGFPFSAFITGIWLKATLGDKIFWIADYRDAWQFEPLFESNMLPFRQRKVINMDSRFLRSADHVLFTTPYTLQLYVDKYPSLAYKCTSITNGYDEDDFTHITPHHFDRFTFLFMGKIWSTSRNPLSLLHAIQRLNNPDLQYIHIGTIGKAVLQQLEEENLGFFSYQGYKSHAEALAYASGADVNVIVLNNDPASACVFPGKLFELLRIDKPILAVGPASSIVGEVLRQTGRGLYADIDNPSALQEAVAKLLSGEFRLNPDTSAITAYSRQSTTRQLMEIYTRQPSC